MAHAVTSLLLLQYYEYLSIEERNAMESEIIRKCLSRNELQVTLTLQQLQCCALDIVKIVYRLAADFPVCLAGKIRSLFTVPESRVWLFQIS